MQVSLIILAMKEELEGVLKHLNSVTKISSKFGPIYEFNIAEEKYIMTLGKIGKVSTGLHLGYLSSIYDIKRVFNVGTAGAFSYDINIGDIVIANEIIYHDVDVTGFNYEYGVIPGCPKLYRPDEEYLAKISFSKNEFDFKIHRGLIISGDTFITKANYKKINSELIEKALCGEMESGAVGQACHILSIPFIVIRSISDYVFDNDNDKSSDSNLEKVSSNAGLVLLKLINYHS